jgi:hypothetical protein
LNVSLDFWSDLLTQIDEFVTLLGSGAWSPSPTLSCALGHHSFLLALGTLVMVIRESAVKIP